MKIVILIVFLISLKLFSLEEINLYLKWKHGFQFAGYYAAVKKGYYKKEGLKVNILENESLDRERFSEVLKDKYAYGIETQRILLDKKNRKKIKILSVIFQHSPLITVTLKSSGIKTPQQFTGKKFLGYGLSMEIRAMLIKEGVDVATLTFINRKTYGFEQFLNHEADIVPGYITSLPYKLKKKNVEFNIINPINYGVDFYGDFIFTTVNEIKEHPKRVEKFLRASIKGWEYAMSHKDEIIKYILDTYKNDRLTYDMLKYEAEVMEKDIMMSHFIEIGHMNMGRWKHIEKILKELKLLGPNFNIKDYIYKPVDKNILIYRYLKYSGYALLIISFIAFFLFFFNLKLNKEVKKRIRFAMENEEKFKVIFNNNFQYAAVLDLNGKVLLVNKMAMSITKSEEDKVIGKYFWETPWFKNSKEAKDKIKNAIMNIKNEPFVRFEIKNKADNGKLIYVDVSIKAVKNANGEFDYVIIEGRDITDFKNMEKIIGNSQKMEAIGLLAGGIAHDFNNIISAIIGNAELIKMDMDNNEYADELEQIIKAGKRAKKLVNRIIAFSKGVEEEKKNINLIVLIDGIVKLILPTIDTDKIKINKIYKNNAPVNGIYTQLEQVVMNIIRNAAQAIEGKGEINIILDKVKVEEDLILFDSVLPPDTYVKLTIEDTGCGIEQKNINRIFEPYYSTKNKKDGTGLGLFVVHGIIEKHNAYLDVKSVPGKGTKFEIYFPIISYEFDSIRTNTYTYNESDIILGEKQKILFVDDEEMIAKNMYKILSKKGFSVDIFTNPEEALNEFRKSSNEYDIVITDQNMPEMTGVELVGEIKKIKNDIPVILCSGYNSVVDKSNIDKYGINEFLEKPITVSQLLSVINSILEA